MSHEDWNFDNDASTPQELQPETPKPEIEHDKSGRRAMPDWIDGPKPPPPDPSLEGAYLTKEEGQAQVAEINANHETPDPAAWPPVDQLPQELKDEWGADAEVRYAAGKATFDDIEKAAGPELGADLNEWAEQLLPEVGMALLRQASVPRRSGPIGKKALINAAYQTLSAEGKANLKAALEDLYDDEVELILR